MSTDPAAFGRFASIGDFLNSYRTSEKLEWARELQFLSPELKAARLGVPRNLAEINATVQRREPDDTDANGGQHYRLRIVVLEALAVTSEVAADVADCVLTKREVFLAIRFGDPMGVQTPIPGLEPGAKLHLKGEWITRDKALEHGGERLSVLHFTHHPIGYVCTTVDCYS